MDIRAALKSKWLKFFREHEGLRLATEAYTKACSCDSPENFSEIDGSAGCARCGGVISPVDDPNNAKFMHEACDDWDAQKTRLLAEAMYEEDFGNNGEPIQPEEVDESPFEDQDKCYCCQCREE